MELENKCPSQIEIDGKIEKGKQYDLDIIINEDRRDVVYGVIRDCHKEPLADVVVKLLEVDFKDGMKRKLPVSHTFTNKDGEFVFGPLCEDKRYALEIWGNFVKHIKMCKMCHMSEACLKGQKLDCN